MIVWWPEPRGTHWQPAHGAIAFRVIDRHGIGFDKLFLSVRITRNTFPIAWTPDSITLMVYPHRLEEFILNCRVLGYETEQA